MIGGNAVRRFETGCTSPRRASCSAVSAASSSRVGLTAAKRAVRNG